MSDRVDRIRLLLALGLAAAGCAAPPPSGELGTVQSAIVGGTASNDAPSVVALRRHGGVVCTATLIGLRIAVTAAHCVDGPVPDDVLLEDGRPVAIAGVVVHPGFVRADLSNDVAVVALGESVDPASLSPLLTSSLAGLEGVSLHIVGFGRGGGSSHKTTGTGRLDRLEPLKFVLRPSPSEPCEGDSGGPAFLRVGDREFLAGIVSSGDAACADHGTYLRVDAYRAWLDDEMSRIARTDTTGTEGCAAAPVRGGADTGILVAGLLAIALRKRRQARRYLFDSPPTTK